MPTTPIAPAMDALNRRLAAVDVAMAAAREAQAAVIEAIRTVGIEHLEQLTKAAAEITTLRQEVEELRANITNLQSGRGGFLAPNGNAALALVTDSPYDRAARLMDEPQKFGGPEPEEWRRHHGLEWPDGRPAALVEMVAVLRRDIEASDPLEDLLVAVSAWMPRLDGEHVRVTQGVIWLHPDDWKRRYELEWPDGVTSIDQLWEGIPGPPAPSAGPPLTVEDIARMVAAEYMEDDENMREVYWAPDDDEVRLVGVTSSIGVAPSATSATYPFRFAPDPDVPFKTLFVLVSPDEWERREELAWPDAFTPITKLKRIGNR